MERALRKKKDKVTPIRIPADFFLNGDFKSQKGLGQCCTIYRRIQMPVQAIVIRKLSLIIRREAFCDETCKEFITSKSALQRIPEGILRA